MIGVLEDKIEIASIIQNSSRQYAVFHYPQLFLAAPRTCATVVHASALQYQIYKIMQDYGSQLIPAFLTTLLYE